MKGKREPQSQNLLQSTRGLGFFHKQSELMIMLPEVPKLRNIFDLFVVNGNGTGAESGAGAETEAGAEGMCHQ